MHQPEQGHLEVVARLIGDADLLLGLGQQIEGAQQIFPREALAEGSEPIAFGVGRHVGVADPVRVHRQHQQVAGGARQLAAQQPKVVAALDGPLHQREGGWRVFVSHRLEHVEHEIAADETEHRHHIVDGDRIAGKRAHLIEGAQRVAHAAFASTRQQQQRLVWDLDLLL